MAQKNKFARLFRLLSESLFLCLSQVEVTTVFGSAAPPLTVILVQASSYDKDTPVLENQVMQFSLVCCTIWSHIYTIGSGLMNYNVSFLLCHLNA